MSDTQPTDDVHLLAGYISAWPPFRTLHPDQCTELATHILRGLSLGSIPIPEDAPQIADYKTTIKHAEWKTDVAVVRAAASDEMLRDLRNQIFEPGHPGEPCHRSGWLRDDYLASINKHLAEGKTL